VDRRSREDHEDTIQLLGSAFRSARGSAYARRPGSAGDRGFHPGPVPFVRARAATIDRLGFDRDVPRPGTDAPGGRGTALGARGGRRTHVRVAMWDEHPEADRTFAAAPGLGLVWSGAKIEGREEIAESQGA
jgi:hypothetical protein